MLLGVYKISYYKVIAICGSEMYIWENIAEGKSKFQTYSNIDWEIESFERRYQNLTEASLVVGILIILTLLFLELSKFSSMHTDHIVNF